MTVSGVFTVEFFALQLRFAARVAEVSGISLPDAIGSYTNIYVRLGMGQRFSQVNPEWQRFVNELMKAQDQAKYTHAVHCDRIHLPAGPKLERTVGCFSYALAEPGCVRLHFNSRDQTQESPFLQRIGPRGKRSCLSCSLISGCPPETTRGSLELLGCTT